MEVCTASRDFSAGGYRPLRLARRRGFTDASCCSRACSSFTCAARSSERKHALTLPLPFVASCSSMNLFRDSGNWVCRPWQRGSRVGRGFRECRDRRTFRCSNRRCRRRGLRDPRDPERLLRRRQVPPVPLCRRSPQACRSHGRGPAACLLGVAEAKSGEWFGDPFLIHREGFWSDGNPSAADARSIR